MLVLCQCQPRLRFLDVTLQRLFCNLLCHIDNTVCFQLCKSRRDCDESSYCPYWDFPSSCTPCKGEGQQCFDNRHDLILIMILANNIIFLKSWDIFIHKKHKVNYSLVFCLFLVGAFLKKRARLLQSLVFFIQDRLEATNVKINVQLINTVLNYWTGKGKQGAHSFTF